MDVQLRSKQSEQNKWQGKNVDNMMDKTPMATWALQKVTPSIRQTDDQYIWFKSDRFN